MAVTRPANIVKMTANADTIAATVHTLAIKIIDGGGGSTVTLTDPVGGATLYFATQTAAQEKFEELPLYAENGVTLALTGTATVYLYCK